jgi:ATP-dependent helicase/nuclease subunit B
MFPKVAPEEWWELTLQFYAETVQYDEKPPAAIELQGWLELLWEDAPHLIVCGFNDGRVPESVVGDPFLPESLRERLGLKTNATRFARDAYLLQAIAHSRTQSGRLDILLGKTSMAGDPLRPSRLLLRCADVALPQRVEYLFRPAEVSGSNLAWTRAWQLRPRRVAAPSPIAVTALRSWLACPFRFYLSYVLRMKPVDSAKTELDVFDFGILCHSALEAMGGSSAMRDCVDPVVIREFLLGKLEEDARERFGTQLTLPLVVQLESARQRLSRAADIQAGTRAEGWVVQAVETSFELGIGGLQIKGKIDRIDRHERTGAMRVLDYKTSDQPVDPWHAHVRGIRKTETPPEFARFILNGREHVWNDLQLPLYLRALRTGGLAAHEMGPDTSVVGAYFNLPKASSETGIRAWEDYNWEIDDAAWRCAEGAAQAIREGVFWPPNENVRPDFDDFAPLFHHGVADSVAWNDADAVPQNAGLDAEAKGSSS